MHRNIKIGMGTAILLVLVVLGYSAYKNNTKDHIFIREINPNLTLEERKIYEDKITDIQKKLKDDPSPEEKFNLLMQLGFNQYGLGKYTDAKNSINEAKKIKSDDPAVYVALYQVKLDMQDNEGAKQDIVTATKLDPENADAWKKYIVLEIERFKTSNDRISALYSEAVVKSQSHIDIITAYADWLEKVGNYQASKEYWQKARELNPANKEVYDTEIKKLIELIKQQQ